MITEQGAGTERIVAGIDGSPSSKAALVWSVRQAERTGGTVEAVTAWHDPVVLGAPFGPASVLPETDFAEVATRVLRQVVSETADPAGPVKVSSIVTQGAPRGGRPM